MQNMVGVIPNAVKKSVSWKLCCLCYVNFHVQIIIKYWRTARSTFFITPDQCLDSEV